MARERLDGFVVTKGEHLDYLFGFRGSAGLAWVGPDDAVLIVDSRYLEKALAESEGCRPTLAAESIRDALRDTLAGLPTGPGRSVGFESAHVSHDWALGVQAWDLPLRWTPCRDLVERLRSVKDASEIAAIENAFAAAQDAYREALAGISPGISEKEAAGILELEMRRRGGEATAFETIVASGPRSSLPHGTASDREISDRDLVLIDFGIRLDSYHSDLTRIHFMPRAARPEIYAVVDEARRAAIEAVRPGVAARQIDAAARRVIEKAGYGERFGHGTGHGLGLEVHELPRVSRLSEEEIRPGMVFTVEPGIYLPGRYGVRIEDAVVVTEKGCRLLSRPD